MNEIRPSKLTEYALLAGSGAGAIASVAAQNAIYASAPLTLLAAVGVLNRNRLEQQLKNAETELTQKTNRLTQGLTQVSKQVSALPSPEAFNTFQRAAVSRTDRVFVRFSQELKGLQREMEQRFDSLHIPKLEPIHQEVDQLREEIGHLHTSLENVVVHVGRLSTSPRLELAENQLAQLKTEVMQLRVNLESITGESRTAIAQLGDSVGHVERGLKQLPVILDPRLIREELQHLVHTVTDLVPQRDFNNLAFRLQELQHRHNELQRSLDALRQERVSPQPVAVPNLANLQRQITEISQRQQSFPQIRAQMETLLGQTLEDVWQQLTDLETSIRSLAQQEEQINQQVETHHQVSQSVVVGSPLDSDTPELKLGSAAVTGQWLMDFPGPTLRAQSLGGRWALESALAQAQERLLLVWPWCDGWELDASLLSQFRQLLERGAQLEIGWCHRDKQPGRLLRAIRQRWHIEATHLKPLKSALKQLLLLRQAYPRQFRFKILGTDESFLVCDRSFAVLGVQELSALNTVVPRVGLRLQVQEPAIVEAFIRRFDDPSLVPENVEAYFNRATTRYDLRDYPGAIADYSQVVAMEANHAVALNNRGVVYEELGRSADAEADFTQAIATGTDLFAAYCNRGWLRLEQNRFPTAIQDFTRAVRRDPDSPIAYLYRGSALQQLGDLNGAIADYSRAIVCGHSHSLPYIYRSAAHQQRQELPKAVADLELAQQILKSNGEQPHTQATVERLLSKLRSYPTIPQRGVQVFMPTQEKF